MQHQLSSRRAVTNMNGLFGMLFLNLSHHLRWMSFGFFMNWGTFAWFADWTYVSINEIHSIPSNRTRGSDKRRSPPTDNKEGFPFFWFLVIFFSFWINNNGIYQFIKNGTGVKGVITRFLFERLNKGKKSWMQTNELRWEREKKSQISESVFRHVWKRSWVERFRRKA